MIYYESKAFSPLSLAIFYLSITLRRATIEVISAATAAISLAITSIIFFAFFTYSRYSASPARLIFWRGGLRRKEKGCLKNRQPLDSLRQDFFDYVRTYGFSAFLCEPPYPFPFLRLAAYLKKNPLRPLVVQAFSTLP